MTILKQNVKRNEQKWKACQSISPQGDNTETEVENNSAGDLEALL